MSPIRIALIEDSPLLREGLASVIARHDDFDIVANAGDLEADALAILGLGIDVLLIDFELPREQSLRLAHRVCRQFPRTAVVLLNVAHDDVHVLEFVQAGVAGFVLKDAALDGCLAVIRRVARGGKVLPRALTGPLFADIVNRGQRRRTQGPSRMTRREREVAGLITAGLSNKEIAEQLSIATHTVKSHVHNLFEKLELNRRVELVSYMARNGLPRSSAHH
jgi:DNA-binding NarL/FixJ family response regulator